MTYSAVLMKFRVRLIGRHGDRAESFFITSFDNVSTIAKHVLSFFYNIFHIELLFAFLSGRFL